LSSIAGKSLTALFRLKYQPANASASASDRSRPTISRTIAFPSLSDIESTIPSVELTNLNKLVVVRALLAQLRVELTLTLRRGESLLITLVVPVVLLVFFGGIAASPPEFLVPGLVALAVMSTSMVSLGIATAYERYYGALKRLLGSPIPRTTLIAAKTLAILLVELVQMALLLGIARLAFGWRPGGSLPAAAAVVVLGSLAFGGLGLLMAGTLRAEATLAVANGLYLVFLLVGGFILPLERLPAPLEVVAHALPPAALTDAMRAALAGANQEVLGPLALLAVWAVVAMGAAALTFKPE
jgi:ABC-2 type transport system permease protein